MVTRTDFERAITDEDVRALRLVQLGFIAGPLTFLAVILFTMLSSNQQEPGPAGLALVRTLTIVHLVVFVVAVGARILVPERVVAAAAPKTAADLWAAHKNATLVGLGLLEGAALFGLVVCVTAALGGILSRYPVVWVNLVSLATVVVHGVATFPSRDRFLDAFDQRAR